VLVLRHRKFRQYFTRSYAQISALKIESFRNFATVFKITAKKFKITAKKFKITAKKKISESIVYRRGKHRVFSQLIFSGGQRSGIDQGGGNILRDSFAEHFG